MTATQIHPAAHVDGCAHLGAGVRVDAGAIVGPNVRIGDRTRVGSNCLVTGWTQIGSDCDFHHGAVIGSPPQDLKYNPGEPSYLEVGDHTVIREYATLNLATEPGATTRVGSHCLLMAYSHIAHNCHVGDRVVLANLVQLAGYVTVDDWAIIGGGTVVHQFVRIGRHAMVGGASRIIQDVAPFIKAGGNPPRLGGLNGVGLERRGFSQERRDALGRSYRILFRDKNTVTDAARQIREAFPDVDDVEHMARFSETSLRGLTR
jgi:UDP-N-acetylglucosamine acyltransferase